MFTPFPAHGSAVTTSIGTGIVHSVWSPNGRHTVVVKMDLSGRTLAFPLAEVKW